MTKPYALIIGVGPGLGAALARGFAGAGLDIAPVARQVDRLHEVAAMVSALGAQTFANPADASRDADLSAALQALVAAHGAPAVAIYNVSRFRQVPVLELGVEQLIEDFRTDVAGALTMVKAVAPAMQAAGGGSMFLTGGGTALRPEASIATLGIGKAGLRNFAFALAPALAPMGIAVRTVTITGPIAAGTPFDPDRIAATYVRLHQQGGGDIETVFSG